MGLSRRYIVCYDNTQPPTTSTRSASSRSYCFGTHDSEAKSYTCRIFLGALFAPGSGKSASLDCPGQCIMRTNRGPAESPVCNYLIRSPRPSPGLEVRQAAPLAVTATRTRSPGSGRLRRCPCSFMLCACPSPEGI